VRRYGIYTKSRASGIAEDAGVGAARYLLVPVLSSARDQAGFHAR
jgi:hypothetical protein